MHFEIEVRDDQTASGMTCLPKDVRALTYHARTVDTQVPLLDSILPSNENQIAKAFDMIASEKGRRIGVLGFSFKAGTDDLRESPVVELIEKLIGKGYELRLFDRNVHVASLVGANKDYILNHIPHIARLMTDEIDDVINFADIIVVGNNDPEFASVLAHAPLSQHVIDLVGVDRKASRLHRNYEGICW